MIQSFRHRGLKRFYDTDDRRGVRADQVDKIARILARLDEADLISKINLPGFRLHRLSMETCGDLKGFWAVRVTANWRNVFRLEGGQVHDVDLIDYHLGVALWRC